MTAGALTPNHYERDAMSNSTKFQPPDERWDLLALYPPPERSMVPSDLALIVVFVVCAVAVLGYLTYALVLARGIS
jgi:hypothetical protein